MNRKQVDRLMSLLIGVSSFLLLLGAFFQLQHYPHGNLILWIGIMSSLILSGVEIDRLKRIIKIMEQENLKK